MILNSEPKFSQFVKSSVIGQFISIIIFNYLIYIELGLIPLIGYIVCTRASYDFQYLLIDRNFRGDLS